jgi:hypothetical protein
MPDGISGNEDCGQMSAWYIFSSLGFYPVTPGSNQYIIGAPLFEKATIHLENGKSFTVQANNQSEENKYIQSVKLNGENYEFSYIEHQDIMKGGSLVFEMTNERSTWGTKDAFIPTTKIEAHVIVAAPFIAKGEIAFKGSTEVSLGNADEEASIYYSLGVGFQKYKQPFMISEKASLRVYAEKNSKKSTVIKTDFYKIDPNLKIDLQTEYANQYNAGGDNALIDGVLGAEDFRTGTWQGYFDVDLNAIVDLGKETLIYNLKVSFLKDQRSWIFLPKEVDIFTSLDGLNFKKESNWKFKILKNTDEVKVETIHISKLGTARFIKVIAKKIGKLPEWHLGAKHNGRSWLFVDEIQIN